MKHKFSNFVFGRVVKYDMFSSEDVLNESKMIEKPKQMQIIVERYNGVVRKWSYQVLGSIQSLCKTGISETAYFSKCVKHKKKLMHILQFITLEILCLFIFGDNINYNNIIQKVLIKLNYFSIVPQVTYRWRQWKKYIVLWFRFRSTI